MTDGRRRASAAVVVVASAARVHWDEVWTARAIDEVSWFRAEPTTSLRMIDEAGVRAGAAVVDVGGGASTLPVELLDRGLDVTVLDISSAALDVARRALGDAAGAVQWVVDDVTTWTPTQQHDLWHDRAVFHFLVDPADQDRYVEVASAAVRPGGAVVLGTFAPDGPSACSGLPVARHDAADLARRFAPTFVLEAQEREVHRTPAGVEQAFTWVVLRRTVT
ncbi:MAG: class I SAM-dependent methyltransferase [Acidimicrobiales bacterium]